MATPILPRAQAPIAGNVPTTREWYDFFRKLLEFVGDNSDSAAQIQDILARLEALENEEDPTAVIQGLVTVQVIGSLESGLVAVQLLNDQVAPGNTYYYGTDATGAKGWFTVSSAITTSQPGITKVVAADGVVDIRPANDLAAVEALATTGGAYRTGSETWALRTLQPPAAGLTISNPGGVAGNPTFALANDLAAVEGLSGTGIAVRTAADTWTTRTITAGAAITVTNGDGVAGNPAVAHTDTSSVSDINSDNSNGVVIQDFVQTFDTFGHVQTVSVVTADVWTLPASSYRTLLTASSIITAGSAAGTYAMTAGGDGCVLSGADTAIPLQSIYIDSADYPVIGTLNPKLRIRVQLYTNDTAPTGNYTFGLYPITRPGTSGGSGVNAYTIGTVVTGSDGATFTAPAADGLLNAVGADFALPSNGHYVIGVVTTAAPAANSNIQITASLQMRNA